MESILNWIKYRTSDNPGHIKPVDGEWGKFYSGLSDGKEPVLYIPQNSAPDETFEAGIFSVSSAVLEPLGGNARYCKISWGADQPFDFVSLFLQDLFRTQDFTIQPYQTLRNKQKIWQPYLNKRPSSNAISALTGLWGELYFNRTFPELAVYWTGPVATAKDINHPKFSLDIKTTRYRNREKIQISSAEQLEADAKPIYIAIIHIENAGADGFSLNDLAEHAQQMQISESVKNRLNDVIQSMDEALLDWKFGLQPGEGRIALYEVNEDIPRITRTSLNEWFGREKASRLSNITYSLNLTGLNYKTLNNFRKLLNDEFNAI